MKKLLRGCDEVRLEYPCIADNGSTKITPPALTVGCQLASSTDEGK
jgi:hypothetical protein